MLGTIIRPVGHVFSNCQYPYMFYCRIISDVEHVTAITRHIGPLDRILLCASEARKVSNIELLSITADDYSQMESRQRDH